MQELRRQCQQFAVDLLDQTRSSEELAVILNHEQYSKCDVDISETDTVQLPLLHLAIKYKQKKVRTSFENVILSKEQVREEGCVAEG